MVNYLLNNRKSLYILSGYLVLLTDIKYLYIISYRISRSFTRVLCGVPWSCTPALSSDSEAVSVCSGILDLQIHRRNLQPPLSAQHNRILQKLHEFTQNAKIQIGLCFVISEQHFHKNVLFTVVPRIYTEVVNQLNNTSAHCPIPDIKAITHHFGGHFEDKPGLDDIHWFSISIGLYHKQPFRPTIYIFLDTNQPSLTLCPSFLQTPSSYITRPNQHQLYIQHNQTTLICSSLVINHEADWFQAQ